MATLKENIYKYNEKRKNIKWYCNNISSYVSYYRFNFFFSCRYYLHQYLRNKKFLGKIPVLFSTLFYSLSRGYP